PLLSLHIYYMFHTVSGTRDPAYCAPPTLRLLLLLLYNPRPHTLHLLHRPIRLPRLYKPQPPHDPHTTLDPPKDSMLRIQPRRRRERDEELAPVRVLSRVGHREDTRAGVSEGRVDLVGEGGAPAGCAPAASAGRVAGLQHEVGD